ncbi:biotin/lipoyl-containing protein, partial [Actinomyces sp. oral taxon 170]
TVEVGTVLAIIGDPSEAGSAPAAPAEAPAAPEPTPAAEPAPAPAAPPVPAPAAGSAEGTEVTMPALGESVTEGTVSSWLKAVGDTVEADEPLLEVATDKVDTEVPSPASGVLLEIRVPEDETVEVGTVLAIVGSPSTAPAAAPAPA